MAAHSMIARASDRAAPVRPALGWSGSEEAPAGPPPLVLGRAHELCGPARRVLAAMVAGRMAGPGGDESRAGPVLWIRPAHAEGRLNPEGLARFFDPARLVLAVPQRAQDVLWIAEEALRSGAAPLVIAELDAPPGLTPVRRLHLAAEAGALAARASGGAAGGGRGAPAPPLALLLTPDQGGAQGVESRWSLAAAPGRPAERGGDRARDRAEGRAGERTGGCRGTPLPAGAAATAGGAGPETSFALAERRRERSPAEAGRGGFGPPLRQRWELRLLRARLSPPRAWRMSWDAARLDAGFAAAPPPRDGSGSALRERIAARRRALAAAGLEGGAERGEATAPPEEDGAGRGRGGAAGDRHSGSKPSRAPVAPSSAFGAGGVACRAELSAGPG